MSYSDVMLVFVGMVMSGPLWFIIFSRPKPELPEIKLKAVILDRSGGLVGTLVINSPEE